MKQTQDAKPPQEAFSPLVERALAGDQAAYTALYEATAQALYRSIHAMVRSEELTLDIQQEVYASAFTHLDQLEDPEKLLPWLRAIAVNCTRQAMRRKSPVLFSELEGKDAILPSEPADEDPAHCPELNLERRENTRLIREILDGLTDGQRMLVGMYYYEQLPVSRIAEDLGVSPGTVKTQLFRSRKKIEAAVKRLEKQGVKLYGLSPLPFLLALLKRAALPAEAEQAALTGSLAKAGLTAQSVAVHVGRGFFETLGGKLVLGLLSAAVIGGGVLGYGWVKNHLLIGDTRPTETIRIQHSIELPDDSGEELVPVSTEAPEPDTEPEPVTELDSDEDLTEPVTEAAEPSTEAGKDATEHPTPAESNPPSIPTPTESESAQPMPSETSQRPDAEPIFYWAWDTGDQMDWNTGATEAGYESRILTVTLSPPRKPELYAEDASILQITPADYDPSAKPIPTDVTDGWTAKYLWRVKPLTEGVTRLYCTVGGEVLKSLTVTVHTASALLSTGVNQVSPYYEHTEKTMENCVVGTEYGLFVKVQGSDVPEFRCDNPSVALLGPVEEEGSAPTARYYRLNLQIVGAGDARIFVTLGGERKKTWTIHASAVTVDQSDSGEDLIPVDAEPQVMSWYMGRYHRPILIAPGHSEDLYVKMKGAEPPVISVDDPSVLSVKLERSERYEDRNVTEYWYRATALRSGVCTVSCSFGGRLVFTVPIVVP